MFITPLNARQRRTIAWAVGTARGSGDGLGCHDREVLQSFVWSAFCVQWVALGWAIVVGDAKYSEGKQAPDLPCAGCGGGHDVEACTEPPWQPGWSHLKAPRAPAPPAAPKKPPGVIGALVDWLGKKGRSRPVWVFPQPPPPSETD